MASSSALALPPILQPTNPDLVSPVSVASTLTRKDVIHFWGVCGILNHTKISAPNPDDRVTSGLEDGIAFYEAFLYASLRFLLHPFIISP